MNAGLRSALTVFSWALYDFSDAMFGMNILAFSFALYLTVEKGIQDIVYGCALGISMFLASLFMPILGVISDKQGRRMPYLIFFTLLCIIFLILMGITDNVIMQIIFFCISNFGYLLSGAVFYNALLTSVADKADLGRVSGYGVSLSYAGILTGLIIIRPYALRYGYQATFIPTALFFLIFALPCFFFVKEKKMPITPNPLTYSIREAFKTIARSIYEIKKSRELLSFFLGIFIVVNIINAIFVFMSVYLKKAFNFSDSEILVLYIVSTAFSITGALSSGFITDKTGPKKALIGSILLCCAAMFIAVLSPKKEFFWISGPMAALSFSGVRVSGRALAIELFPKERMGEVFGILGFLSNLAFIGFLLWGLMVYLFTPLGMIRYRITLLISLIILVLGGLILQRTSTERSRI